MSAKTPIEKSEKERDKSKQKRMKRTTTTMNETTTAPQPHHAANQTIQDTKTSAVE
jgi:hypothetical protein